KDLFEQGKWPELRALARSRIGAYDRWVREAVETITREYPAARNDGLWPGIKLTYAPLLINHQQPELAETFYNSVACRLLHRTYYHNDYIFWRPQISTENIESVQPTYRCYYPATDGLRKTLRQVVADLELTSPWENLERDLAAVLRVFRGVVPRTLEAG